MTSTVLSGKPNSGNPHVASSLGFGVTCRFDNGQVAQEANPRGVSPLYKIRYIIGVAVTAVAVTALAVAPEWPSTFGSQVSALVASYQPTDTAVDEETLATAFDSFAYSVLPSASYGSAVSPFSSCWLTEDFSGLVWVKGTSATGLIILFK